MTCLWFFLYKPNSCKAALFFLFLMNLSISSRRHSEILLEAVPEIVQ